MKKKLLLIILLLTQFSVHAQVLGGFNINGYLASAVHPNGCIDTFVTNLPDSDIWVNFLNGDTMTGLFSQPAVNAAGPDVLLETGYNQSNYIVDLLLSTGQYSAVHNVYEADWTVLTGPVGWSYLQTNCIQLYMAASQFILPLDFANDFGLTSTDTVTGIRIVFLTSTGWPDLAGVYLISQPNGIIEAGEMPGLNLFPVPFSGEINITLNDSKASEFRLYNALSQNVLHQKFTGSATINCEHLSKGIYFYEIISEGMVTGKGKVAKK